MQPSRLLAAARRVVGSPDRVPRVIGVQRPPNNLPPKAHLHSVESHTRLVLYECHRTLFSGLREVDVSLLGSAHSLLTEVPAEAISVVGAQSSGDFGLDIPDQPEASMCELCAYML